MWMTPYGYTSNLPANNDAQTAMSQQAVAALTAVNGTQVSEGTAHTGTQQRRNAATRECSNSTDATG